MNSQYGIISEWANVINFEFNTIRIILKKASTGMNSNRCADFSRIHMPLFFLLFCNFVFGIYCILLFDSQNECDSNELVKVVNVIVHCRRRRRRRHMAKWIQKRMIMITCYSALQFFPLFLFFIFVYFNFFRAAAVTVERVIRKSYVN